MTNYQTIIPATALAEALAEALESATEPPWAVFDCRAQLSDPGYGSRAFREGHVRGAQRLDLEVDLAAAPLTAPVSADARPGGRHPLPDRDRLSASLRARGVRQDEQIVVYDDRDGAFAARAWWCIRWLGHSRVAVLDGGLAAFAAACPELLSQGDPGVPQPGDFSPQEPLTRALTADVIQQRVLPRSAPGQLLDARGQPRYDGVEEPIDPVAGHIPGALCRPFTENLTEIGQFKAPEELAAAFAPLGHRLVCYCGSGVTATHNILAAVHGGQPEPALYPGSWSDWIRDPDRPCEPVRSAPPPGAP